MHATLPAEGRKLLAQVVRRHADALVHAFYANLLEDPEAAPSLSHELVTERLSRSMQRWLTGLFCADTAEEVVAAMALQRKVGEVHARIHIPMHLVIRGTRVLKAELAAALRRESPPDMLVDVLLYMDSLFDIALEKMSLAFMRDLKRGVRTDEAYRLFALGQNISAERERQRAALLEWGHSVLVALHARGHDDSLPRIASAEFGLWLHHKGSAMFEGTPELDNLLAAAVYLDETLLPTLTRANRAGQADQVFALVNDLQARLAEIKYFLTQLFDQVAEIESGSDPLTNVLNRRFLPSVLAREVAIAIRDHSAFSVLLIDVDHFKQINDTFGHDGGDHVLRQAAELLHQTCRSSDFVFRYGGEEFLVVLVDIHGVNALRIAEKLREAFAQHTMRLPDKRTVSCTISVGVASFDGHPDYEYLITRADRALYRAKEEGRNRCVVA